MKSVNSFQTTLGHQSTGSNGRIRRTEKFQGMYTESQKTDSMFFAFESISKFIRNLYRSAHGYIMNLSEDKRILEAMKKFSSFINQAKNHLQRLHLKERMLKLSGIIKERGKKLSGSSCAKPHGMSLALLIVAAVMLLLAGIGFFNAAQLNAELARNGMGYLTIDEAISLMNDLAKYSRQSAGDYLNGANAFILFTVTKRTILCVIGLISLLIGSIQTIRTNRLNVNK